MSFMNLIAGMGGAAGQLQPPAGMPQEAPIPAVTQVQTPGEMPEINPMRRFLAGLGQAAAGARPGLSPGMAFTQGLGGGIQGGMGYETQQQQLHRQMEQDRRQRENDAFQRAMGLTAADDRRTRTDLARQGQEDQRNYRQESLEIARARVQRAAGTQQYPHIVARERARINQRAYEEVFGRGNIGPTWEVPANTPPGQRQQAQQAEYQARRQRYYQEAGLDDASVARWRAPEGAAAAQPAAGGATYQDTDEQL